MEKSVQPANKVDPLKMENLPSPRGPRSPSPIVLQGLLSRKQSLPACSVRPFLGVRRLSKT